MKVLLVDDSGLSRKVQAKVLRELGVDTIVEAKNGADALTRLEQQDFRVDLVMTDWNMPEMNGLQLIQELRRAPRGRNLPVIVVSSEGEEARIGEAFAVGANSYVTKPFKKEILARKIEGVRCIAQIKEARDTAAEQGDTPPLMEGDLERLGFAELVGFLNFSKKTGELLIELESGEAGISFDQGEVKEAWIGRFSSEAAFFAIARLRQGRFRFHEGRPPRASRITQGTLSLLMEAMRLIDEESTEADHG